MDEANIPTATVVGVSTGEDIHERIDRYVVDVPEVVGVHFHLGAIGTDAYDAAAEFGEFCAIRALRIHESEIAQGDVDPAIDTHLDAIGGVISAPILIVFQGGYIPDQDFGLSISDTIVVLILQNPQMHPCHDIGFSGDDTVKYVELIPIGDETARVVNVGKHGVLVGYSIVVRINELDDTPLTGAFPK